MGHKVHPYVHRLGIIRDWHSRWFATPKKYGKILREDLTIRKTLKKRLEGASLDRITIERSSADDVHITIATARPGVVIGRGGGGIEELTKFLRDEVIRRPINVRLSVVEIKKPALSAMIVVQDIISDLERRIPFRRVLKSHLQRMRESGALGAKVSVSGRLDGAEIARYEHLEFGTLPLSTLRADIDYGRGAAWTTYGTIGVKVWINRGEIFTKAVSSQEPKKIRNQ